MVENTENLDVHEQNTINRKIKIQAAHCVLFKQGITLTH